MYLYAVESESACSAIFTAAVWQRIAVMFACAQFIIHPSHFHFGRYGFHLKREANQFNVSSSLNNASRPNNERTNCAYNVLSYAHFHPTNSVSRSLHRLAWCLGSDAANVVPCWCDWRSYWHHIYATRLHLIAAKSVPPFSFPSRSVPTRRKNELLELAEVNHRAAYLSSCRPLSQNKQHQIFLIFSSFVFNGFIQ